MKKRIVLCLTSVVAVGLCMAAYKDNKLKPEAGEQYGMVGVEEMTESSRYATYQDAKAGVALSDLVYRQEHIETDKCAVHLDDGEISMLLQIASAEAGTEDVEGKALVMRVVLNRVESEEFPDTVSEVINQHRENIYQFSPVGNGTYKGAEITESCYIALEMVLSGWDESQGATYFCTPDTAYKWHEEHLEYLFTHGRHRFYKGVEDKADKVK